MKELSISKLGLKIDLLTWPATAEKYPHNGSGPTGYPGPYNFNIYFNIVSFMPFKAIIDLLIFLKTSI